MFGLKGDRWLRMNLATTKGSCQRGNGLSGGAHRAGGAGERQHNEALRVPGEEAEDGDTHNGLLRTDTDTDT